MAAGMGVLRWRGGVKRAPLGLWIKVALAGLLGLVSVVIWSTLSSSSSSQVSFERSSFGDIEVPPGSLVRNRSVDDKGKKPKDSVLMPPPKDESLDQEIESGSTEEVQESDVEIKKEVVAVKNETASNDENQEEEEREGNEGKGDSEEVEEVGDSENGVDVDLEDGVDVESGEVREEDGGGDESKRDRNNGKKKRGPLFDSRARYDWKLCSPKTGHHYIPCVDMEGGHRHHERSCPPMPLMCLVPLPEDYKPPFAWPERESKVWYKNVAHPKLSAFIKTQSWIKQSGDYLFFPEEESGDKVGDNHYIESIEEMVPDIEFGKNIRVVLDIGSTSATFEATLLKKDVIALSMGLMSDQTELSQLTLERGLPAVVGNLGLRRLPFPGVVFDAVHCGECNVPWHSNGGKLLLEVNRILRPGGYFITSSKNGDIESEEGMLKHMESLCWNVLAHKVDEDNDMSLRIFQRPASNDVYELRRTKDPPFCKESDNQDTAWYTPIKPCLHKLPAAIEERGTDWPEEWPKRLETFPEWLGDLQEKLNADHEHWKAIIEKSYLVGLGIDWSSVRNVMDMKTIYGGFAAALSSQNVWVMNVVPVHAPNTLPIIFERGLVGIYHNWCEPFSTYPRSYDLLHADHLFSRLKNSCKQPIVIVVEMDRILRPGGWAIIRDKLEILNPLETILKSLHWEVQMTYGKDKEGIICVQKTTWRP